MRAIASSGSVGYSSCTSIRRPTVPSRYRVHRTTQRRHYSTLRSEKESPAERASNGPTEGSYLQSKSLPSDTTTGSVASSAGAATPPVTVPASRSLRQIIQSSPIGKFGRFYGRAQEKRPYVTQLCSSLVVYLCGDLSAQLLFPSDDGKKASAERKSPENVPGQGGEDAQQVEEKRGGYDPLRTLRHLTVGLVSSIPSYKW